MSHPQYGRFIKHVRQQYGLTLPELAEKAGISQGNLSKIENGGNFTISTLISIASALDVSPQFLLNMPVEEMVTP